MKRHSSSQFILDCSVTMAWCFEDEVTPYSEGVMDSLLNAEAIVPFLWLIEVANVLVLAERKKRISLSKLNSFISMLEKLPIKVEEGVSKAYLENIFRVAKENHLTAYDAVYLDLAFQHGLPIATTDKELRKAAHSHGIELFSNI